MTCKRCSCPMQPVRVANPKELIEVDNMDFFGCKEVVMWCCERCGYTIFYCSNNGQGGFYTALKSQPVI